jgi:hypothetical protein
MDKGSQRLAKNKTALMPKNASCKRWDTLKVRSVLSSSTLVVDRALAPHPWPAGSGLCGAPAKPALARG